jgi:hypothetical protein
MADLKCPWEKISKFVSPGELSRFLNWMQDQISEGIAVEMEAPAEQQLIMGERWFKHVASGTTWPSCASRWPASAGLLANRELGGFH